MKCFVLIVSSAADVMTCNGQGILLILLHHGRIANDVSKEDSSELAVLLFHFACK